MFTFISRAELIDRLKKAEAEARDYKNSYLRVDHILAVLKDSCKEEMANEVSAKTLEIKEKLEKELLMVRQDYFSSKGQLDGAKEQIRDLKELVAHYEEMAKFLATKIPSIDMSKFGITVDVPQPEVKVVGMGGCKK